MMRSSVCVVLIIAVAAYCCAISEAQETVENCAEQSNCQKPGRNLHSTISKLMSINVPMFYEMVRNGSSMGLNVLSGMVKVERGDEAEKNGLVGNGRRPLSVRILGIPVYERGIRVRPPPDTSFLGSSKGNGAEEEGDSAEPLAD